jgi:hypothetical protein
MCNGYSYCNDKSDEDEHMCKGGINNKRNHLQVPKLRIQIGNRRGRDRMIVVLTITYAMNCEFEFRSLRGVFDTTLCGNACQ